MDCQFYDSPLGCMQICADERGIRSISFVDSKLVPRSEPLHNIHLDNCLTQLDEYFKKQRKGFDVHLELSGTDFQQRVWIEVMKIPFGEVRSYKKIAEALGHPRAVRAVGAANRTNPCVIVVPCHRVIGADGKLVGYGGGLWRKKWLLDLELKVITE
ncbi:methylated-DNA--[protein]-cysteine S-methyltransferase [candidate division KSB1 bacterium]|nr:methylated-DNA--[protein]-cysteine S-methyltransferase [candidate division KSB1 bacterium]